MLYLMQPQRAADHSEQQRGKKGVLLKFQVYGSSERPDVEEQTHEGKDADQCNDARQYGRLAS